jgi:hypothetical protein
VSALGQALRLAGDRQAGGSRGLQRGVCAVLGDLRMAIAGFGHTPSRAGAPKLRARGALPRVDLSFPDWPIFRNAGHRRKSLLRGRWLKQHIAQSKSRASVV